MYTSEQIVKAIKNAADPDVGDGERRWSLGVIEWAEKNLSDHEQKWLGGWVE